MGNKSFQKKNQDKKHISGIYNYCDRWCERCPFTSRCLNYKMSEEKFSDQENLDVNNTAFWEKLTETLHETLDLLKEMAEEQGIDLNSIEVEDTDHFGAMTTYFSDCILTGTRPVNDGEEGLADVRAMLAIEEAARTGVPQKIETPPRPGHPSTETVRIVPRTDRRLVF